MTDKIHCEDCRFWEPILMSKELKHKTDEELRVLRLRAVNAEDQDRVLAINAEFRLRKAARRRYAPGEAEPQ